MSNSAIVLQLQSELAAKDAEFKKAQDYIHELLTTCDRANTEIAELKRILFLHDKKIREISVVLRTPYRGVDTDDNSIIKAIEELIRHKSAINIIFDGPPGPIAGRFVEVENDEGESINVGEWKQKSDNYWTLRIKDVL